MLGYLFADIICFDYLSKYYFYNFRYNNNNNSNYKSNKGSYYFNLFFRLL